MILRRFMQHIKDQNWFAVGLDIIVVIVGIFLGMQVTEWNEQRKQAQEWNLALKNLDTEFSVNIKMLQEDVELLITFVRPAAKALDHLLACELDEKDNELFFTGLQSLRGTVGLAVRKRALETILTDARFQSFLTAEKRQYLQELITWLEFVESEAGFFENLPFDDLPEKYDAIKLVANTSEVAYRFSRFNETSGSQTNLELAIPFDEACKNQAFVKSVDWWVRWQSRQLVAARELIERFNISTNEIRNWM